jgi:hypothetical protein
VNVLGRDVLQIHVIDLRADLDIMRHPRRRDDIVNR